MFSSTRQFERADNLEAILKHLRRKGLYNSHELSGLNVFKSALAEPSFTAILTKQQNLLSSYRAYESSNIYGEDDFTFSEALNMTF